MGTMDTVEKVILWVSGVAVVGLILYLVFVLFCQWPAVGPSMPGCV